MFGYFAFGKCTCEKYGYGKYTFRKYTIFYSGVGVKTLQPQKSNFLYIPVPLTSEFDPTISLDKARPTGRSGGDPNRLETC